MGSKFVYQTEPAAAKDAFMALNQSSLKRKKLPPPNLAIMKMPWEKCKIGIMDEMLCEIQHAYTKHRPHGKNNVPTKLNVTQQKLH